MADEQRSKGDQVPGRRVAVVIVHGVGDTQPGLALNEVVDTLEERFKGEVGAEDYSAVYRLASRPVVEGDSEDKFPAYARRARVAGAGEVRFYDLHWADLTHTLPGRLNAFLGAFRIIFESHHFIDAMLPKDAGPLTRLLRRILIYAAAILRGPIVGISACLVLVGVTLYTFWNWLPTLAAYLAGPEKAPNPEAALVWVVISLMLGLSMIGLALFYRRARSRETEWNDVAIAVIAGSWFVAGYTWLLYKFPDVQFLRGTERAPGESYVCSYIDRFYYISQSIRVVWCALVMAALAIITWLFWFARRSATEARAGAAMAATSIVVLQSALWLTLLSAFAIPILRDTRSHGIPECSLGGLYVSFAGTATLLLCVALVLVLTYAVRAMIARTSLIPLAYRARFMPRMLFGGAVTLAILVGAAAQVGMFAIAYITAFVDNNIVFQSLEGILTDKARSYFDHIYGYKASFTGAVGVTALGASVLITIGLGTAIHITRDLIDHHYSPSLGYSHYLLPASWRVGPTKPRRERISERFNTLVRDVISRDPPYQDLIFVVHSQGSVIVYDYLLKESSECKDLLCVQPHLITFGSPLSHLYQFYFKEYADLDKGIARLRPKLSSWTNLYRVDDYVGRTIKDGEGFVRNVVIRAGGHIDYWREPALCDIILDRIRTSASAAQQAPR